jgi:hypothetical protein
MGPECAQGETCCWGLKPAGAGSFDPSSCAASVEDCPDPTDPAKEKLAFDCQETSDCGSGEVCCIVPDTKGSFAGKAPKIPTAACGTLITNAGTRCQASCGANDVQACQTDAECTGGKKCQLAKVAFGNVTMGACK